MARKQGRVEQKQKKAQYFSTGKKRHADEVEGDEPNGTLLPKKKARISKDDGAPHQNQSGPKSAGVNSTGNTSMAPTAPLERGKGREAKEKKKFVPVVAPPRSRVEEEEDAYIVHLEKKLGYGKQRHKESSLEEDGLDGKLYSPLVVCSGGMILNVDR